MRRENYLKIWRNILNNPGHKGHHVEEIKENAPTPKGLLQDKK